MTINNHDHEFYPVWLRREEVEETLDRSITDVEWYSLVEKVGMEIDRVDAEVVEKAIAELKGN